MKTYDFDSLKFATEGLTGFGCTIVKDDVGLPSFMIPFNKRTNAQLFTGGSQKTHSAFIVDDVEYNRFLFSKFINCIVNGRAYSWPGVDPTCNVNFDQAMNACNAKGPGFHLGSIPERAVINHLIHKSEFEPRGNTNYGAHHTYTYEVGEPSMVGSDHRTNRTATGSGPATWFHDGTRAGIADWVGNVWKWCSGLRIVNGEIQIMVQNAPAKQASHAEASTYWKAILQDGSLVNPGTANTLKVNSSGNIGTDRVGNAATSKAFQTVAAASGVTIPEILYELFLAPKSGETYTGNFWYNTEGERLPLVGGHWSSGADAGSAALHLSHPRTSSNAGIGFFSAFLEM